MPDLPTLPAISSQPISVILLARPEESQLPQIIRQWVDQLSLRSIKFEILLIDASGQDWTANFESELKAISPAIRLVLLGERLGIGAALKRGLEQAQFPLLLYTTADRQYSPESLPDFLKEMDKVHLISGYRRWQPVPFILRILGGTYRLLFRLAFDFSPERLPGWLGWKETLYRFFIRMIFGVRSRDVRCAYFLGRREIFERIPIQSTGPFALTEVLIKANFLGCILGEEVPVSHQPRSDAEGDWTGNDYRLLRQEASKIFRNAKFDSETIAESKPNTKAVIMPSPVQRPT
jgi:glycosyltransferase involved in cell wall biosynthesis